MFCQNCGNELADGAAFCPSCGTAQNNAAVSLSKGVAAAAGAANVADERKQVLAVMDNSFSVMTSIKKFNKPFISQYLKLLSYFSLDIII